MSRRTHGLGKAHTWSTVGRFFEGSARRVHGTPAPPCFFPALLLHTPPARTLGTSDPDHHGLEVMPTVQLAKASLQSPRRICIANGGHEHTAQSARETGRHGEGGPGRTWSGSSTRYDGGVKWNQGSPFLWRAVRSLLEPISASASDVSQLSPYGIPKPSGTPTKQSTDVSVATRSVLTSL